MISLLQDALQEGEESLRNKVLSQISLILEGGWKLWQKRKLYFCTILANYDWVSKAPPGGPSPYLLDTLEFIKARYETNIFTLPNVS